MSEQKTKSQGGPWQSEVIETPKNSKVSRRAFLRLGAAAAGGAALIGAGVVGKKVLEDLGVQLVPQAPAEDNFFYREAQRLTESTRVAPTPFQPRPTSETTPEPSPTPETYNAWVFDNIDLSDSRKQIDMGFYIGQDTILVPYFTPIPFYEGVLEDGAFEAESNTGVTYLDGSNRKILNLHSGRRSALDTRGFTAWDLQKYFEEYPNTGSRRYPREVDEFFKKSVIGSSRVITRQVTVPSHSKIVAAVRVSPEKVAESQEHVGDIVEWLGENYPDFGFASLGKDHETLVIKFCGRILSGEKEDETRPTYQQSRFFLALKKG